MSVLTVCQNAARLLSLNPPNALVGSSNVNALRLLEAFVMAGKYRRRSKQWPQLTRTQVITYVTGQTTYSLNADFLGFINQTVFDVDNERPMEGPLANYQWAYLKYSFPDIGPYQKFRIAGRTNKRFEVHPTPATDGGQVAFHYLSSNWLAPRDWATTTTYSAGSYVSNANGDIYMTSTGGTSGATEPVHTTGTVSDGGVQWTYYSGLYERPTADTDCSVLDEDLLEQDVLWNYRKLSGLDFESFKREADAAWDIHYAQITGAPVLRLGGSDPDAYLLDYADVPDTGYGL
jgi:hypothetical protein